MKLYPSIDLRAGSCVRLYQGCYEQQTVYQQDPLEKAKYFAQEGAEFLHVVDLEGARSAKPSESQLLATLARDSGLKIQAGGGIRTKLQIKEALNNGIARVVLGSSAVLDPETVKEWLQYFGPEQLVLALDVRVENLDQPRLAVAGWEEESGKVLWELLERYQVSSLKHVICTDINRDGTLQGPNLSLYRACVKRFPTYAFQASGGIQSLRDLVDLAAIPLAGAIIGKALYEERFSLSTALAEVSSC